MRQATETELASRQQALNMDQWEFLQTRSVKWKWRQLGTAGAVVSESPEFAFLAHCMKDAELNGFSVDDHIISCEKGAALWSDPPEQPV